MKQKIQVGDEAPDFDLVPHSGEKIRLSDFKDRKLSLIHISEPTRPY